MLIACVTVLVMAGAFMADRVQHRSYASTAGVVLKPQMFASGAEPLPADLGTAKVVATSSVVLDTVTGETKMTLTQLRAGLSVTNPANTSELVFTFRAATPALAQKLAEFTAVAFCDYQNASLSAVERAQAIIAKGGHSDSTLSVEPAAIISPAQLPTKPAGHSLKLDLLVALIAGLGLGLGAALLVDRASDRIRGPGDIQSCIGEPVLAVIPRSSWPKMGSDPLTAIYNDSVSLNAYRALRVRLQDLASPGAPLTVLVTRPVASMRPTLPVSVGLALSFALSGRRVALVGADLQAGTIGRLFHAANVRGVAELLREQVRQPPLVATTSSNVLLLPEGAQTVGAEELVDQTRVMSLNSALEASGIDVIVIDGPPVESPEALAVAAAASQVLLDIDDRRVGRSQLVNVLTALGGHQERLVGAVLQSTKRSRTVRFSRRRAQKKRRQEQRAGVEALAKPAVGVPTVAPGVTSLPEAAAARLPASRIETNRGRTRSTRWTRSHVRDQRGLGAEQIVGDDGSDSEQSSSSKTADSHWR